MSKHRTSVFKHHKVINNHEIIEKYVTPVTRIIKDDDSFEYLSKQTRKTYLATIIKFLKWHKKTP